MHSVHFDQEIKKDGESCCNTQFELRINSQHGEMIMFPFNDLMQL